MLAKLSSIQIHPPGLVLILSNIATVLILPRIAKALTLVGVSYYIPPRFPRSPSRCVPSLPPTVHTSGPSTDNSQTRASIMPSALPQTLHKGCDGVAAFVRSFDKKTKGKSESGAYTSKLNKGQDAGGTTDDPEDGLAYRSSSDTSSSIFHAPRLVNNTEMTRNTEMTQKWLKKINTADFRQLGLFEYRGDEPGLHVPICDTATARLHLYFGNNPIHISDPTSKEALPQHMLFRRLDWHNVSEATTVGTSPSTSTSTERSTSSSDTSGSPVVHTRRLTPPNTLTPPTYILPLGPLVVTPIVNRQHTRDYEDTNFTAFVDATDPSLPLWAIWMYTARDYMDGEFDNVRLTRRDPLFRVLPYARRRAYDTVFLGYLSIARIHRNGTLFRLAKVLENVERSRGRYGPSVSYHPDDETQQGVEEGWKAKRRRILGRRLGHMTGVHLV